MMTIIILIIIIIIIIIITQIPPSRIEEIKFYLTCSVMAFL